MFPPFQIVVPVLQRLYYELSQTSSASYESADFSGPSPPRFFTKRGDKAQSMALFLPDRIVVMEEWTEETLGRFLDRAEEVARRTLQAFELDSFIAQTATVRSTFALTYFNDARQFLLDHVCGQANRIGPHFRRPIGVGGLRMVLPHTPEQPFDIHLIIESFRHDPAQVFVEAKGVFGEAKISESNVRSLRSHITSVRRFVSDNIHSYLEQFDTPDGETLD